MSTDYEEDSMTIVCPPHLFPCSTQQESKAVVRKKTRRNLRAAAELNRLCKHEVITVNLRTVPLYLHQLSRSYRDRRGSSTLPFCMLMTKCTQTADVEMRSMVRFSRVAQGWHGQIQTLHLVSYVRIQESFSILACSVQLSES